MEGLIDINELNDEININPLGVYNKCNDIYNVLWTELSNEYKLKILTVKIKSLAKLKYYDEGIQCCKEAYTLTETKKETCDIYIAHALVESAIDNDLASCDLYFKALRIANELGDWKIVRRIYNNICAIYMHYEAYDEAYEYLLKIQELDKNYNEEIIEGVTTLHQFMAKIYANKKEYTKAFTEIDKAIIYSKKNCHDVNEAFGIIEKALIFKMANNYEEALVLFHKAKNMLSKLDVHSEDFSILIDEIDCYYKLGDMKLAEKSLQELEEYIKRDKFVDFSQYIEARLKVLPNDIKDSSINLALNSIVDEECKFKKNKSEFLVAALKRIRDNHELEIKNEYLQKKNEELDVELKKSFEINEDIKLTLDIGKSIICLNEEEKIINTLYDKIGPLFNIDAIGLISEEDNDFDKVYFIDKKKITILKEKVKKGNTISSIIVDNGLEYFICNNSNNSWEDVLNEMKCLLFIPVKYNGKTNVVLTLQWKGENSFISSLVEYIKQLVPFIAVAINNLRQNKT